jgi:hypothetical protein
VKKRIITRWLVRVRVLPVVATLLWKCCAGSHAQPYAIESYTIDGGGGVSVGSSYTVAGSVGEPDAGTISGGRYTLEGGFWPGVLVVPAAGEAPALFIQFSKLDVILSWDASQSGFTLEQTDDLSSPIWTPAPTGNPVTVSATTGTRFYRLRKQ